MGITFLFVDFISNDGAIAYATDLIKIHRNIALIGGKFQEEINRSEIEKDKNSFITYKGRYIITLKKDLNTPIMIFYDFEKITEFELALWEIEQAHIKGIATCFNEIYLLLSAEGFEDDTGLTS